MALFLKKLMILLFFAVAPIAAEEPLPPTATEAPAKPIPPETPPHEMVPPPLPSSSELTQSYEGAFIRMLATLLGLIVLVFGTFWVLRRMGKASFKMGGGRLINVIEKKVLSPKSMLYLVEVDNKRVLIAESQFEVRRLVTLEELPAEEE